LDIIEKLLNKYLVNVSEQGIKWEKNKRRIITAKGLGYPINVRG
jgi:hypothetical protein